jgi:hypothetical protein
MPWPENIIPDTYPTGAGVPVAEIVGNASNLRAGDNPVYALADFYAMYPQFAASGDPPEQPVAAALLQMFINLANASLQEARWHEAWQLAMGFFVAHFATLWLQSMAAAGSPAAAVLKVGEAKGLHTSKSVGDVSVSIDYSAIAADMDGWAAWKLTVFGQQLATMGRLVGMGGMYVW